MTEKGTPFMIIGTTIIWQKRKIKIVFVNREDNENDRNN